MTTQNAPDKAPTKAPAEKQARDRTVALRIRHEQRPTDPQPVSSWLVWLGIAAAVAAAISLIVVGLGNQPETVSSVPTNEAADARLQGLARQHEAARIDRANEAADARLQGLARQFEAARIARANEAATARLQGLADQ